MAKSGKRPDSGVRIAAGQKPSRLPLIGDDTTDPTVQEIFAKVRNRGGSPLNLHRTLAHAPKLMQASSGVAYSLRYDAQVARHYRELAIIRSVQLHGGHYEEMQHRPMARAAGLSEEQIDAIATWRHSRLFDAPARAVLGWTEGLRRPGGPGDAAYQRMQRFFGPREILELTYAATSYAGTAMLTRALQTPLEPGAGDMANPYGTT